MELRPNNSTHWYNPERDLASQTVQILRQACDAMVQDRLSSNHAVKLSAKEFGITEEHMGKVAEALATYVVITAEDGECHSIQEALGRSGLLDLPEPVLMVAFSLVAQALLGRFWTVVRQSAKPELIVPTFSKEALIDGAAVAQKIFSNKSTLDKANMAKDMKKWAELPPLKP